MNRIRHASGAERTRAAGVAAVTAVLWLAGCAADAEQEMSASPARSADPPAEEPVPDDVASRLSPAVSAFDEPYPPGMTPPTLAELLPWAAGATVVSDDGSEIILDTTDADSGEAVTVATNEGDLAVLAAIDWQCAWIAEFASARQAGASDRVATATAQLERFPDLDVIQEFNPELGEANRDDLIPRIIDGEAQVTESWLNGSCSAASARIVP